MRLLNSTSWASESLREFSLAGLRAKGCDPGEYVVAFTFSGKKVDRELARRHNAERWVGADGLAIHGYAFSAPMWSVSVEGKKHVLRGKRFIRLFLPREQFDLRKLAQVFEHEVDHTLGLRHRDMAAIDDLDPRWHEVVEWKRGEVREEGKEDDTQKKLLYAMRKVKECRTRVKRTQTSLRMWERRVRLYERRLPPSA